MLRVDRGGGRGRGRNCFLFEGGEEEVVFLFLFFSKCCVLSGVGHSSSSSSSSTSFEFFSGIIFFLLSFALYLPSKLETAYHHTHTLSLSDGIQFLLFPLLGSRLDCIKMKRKLLYSPQLPPCNLIPMPKAA